jgi:hypothetical protein
VQQAKQLLAGRCKEDAELVLGNRTLLLEAIMKCWCASHDIRSFEEWVPEYCSGEHRGRHLDEGNGDGDQLLGSGREVKDQEYMRGVLRKVVDVFQEEIRDLAGAAWSEDTVEEAELLEYGRAHVGGREAVFATSYNKSSTRVSYNVYAQYREPGQGLATYVGTVHRFFKASAPGCTPLRVAVADLFRMQQVPSEFGRLWRVQDFTSPKERGYGMLLGHIKWKLLTAKSATGTQAWFVEYSRQSGL